MWEFLKEYPRTRPFQPLHNFTYVLIGRTGDEHVNMVVQYFTRQDLYIMLHSNLAYQVAHTNDHRSCKYFLAILGYPHQVKFKIVFRVRDYSVPFHMTMLREI